MGSIGKYTIFSTATHLARQLFAENSASVGGRDSRSSVASTAIHCPFLSSEKSTRPPRSCLSSPNFKPCWVEKIRAVSNDERWRRARFEGRSLEVLDGTNAHRPVDVSEHGGRQFVRAGPGGEHAGLGFMPGDEPRGIHVQEDEVAVSQVVLPGERSRGVDLAAPRERDANQQRCPAEKARAPRQIAATQSSTSSGITGNM